MLTNVVRLLERTEETRAMRDMLRPGLGGAILIRGDAGTGKSRLLAEAEALARSSGRKVLRCRGTEIARGLDYDAARTLLPGTRLDVPALNAAFIAQRPLAVLVDDAHWLDGPSLRTLAYVADRAHDDLVLVLAMRWFEPGAEPDIFELLAASPGAHILEPAPLTREATGEFLADLEGFEVAADVADAAVGVTGGIPMLIQTLASVEPTAEAIRAAAPERVAWALKATLRAIGPSAEPVARALCVLAEAATVESVAHLAAVPRADARAVIEQLQRAGLVAGATTVHLTPPIRNSAMLATIPGAERALLHHQAAEWYAERGDDERAADHLLATGPRAAEWASRVLLGAADAALQNADPRRAVSLARRALEEPPPKQALATATATAARALVAAGEDAAPAFEAAVLAAEDPTEQAALLLSLAWEHQTRGRFAAASIAAARGLVLETGHHPSLHVELLAMRDAAMLWSPGRPASDEPPRVPVVNDGHAERVALADTARRQMFAGRDHLSAADHALRAWADGSFLTASTADDPVLIRILTVLHNADRQTEALAVAEACLEDARVRCSPMAEATWRHLRGHVYAYMGRLAEAEADLRVGFASRMNGWGAWLPVNAWALAAVLMEQDDLDGAAAVMDTALASGVHPATSPMWATLGNGQGRLALRRDQPAEALEILVTSDTRSRQELGTANPALGTWRHDTALALHGLGRTDASREYADHVLQDARVWGAPRAVGTALRIRGEVGTEDEAASWFEQAVEVLEPSETRLDYAYALVALGGARREQGLLRAGLDLAERCGSLALARQARAHLVAAGARPRRNLMSGPGSLTARELQVARLAATGQTNREIAEALFVTAKSVAFHLGNTYRKLGIEGRGDLPRALESD